MEESKVKTVEEIVRSMSVDDANLRHIAKTGRINGSLSMSIKDALRDYTSQLQSHITKLEQQVSDLETALIITKNSRKSHIEKNKVLELRVKELEEALKSSLWVAKYYDRGKFKHMTGIEEQALNNPKQK